MWKDRRILDLFGIDLPILQAPMAGPTGPDMVIAVSEAGGLGSLPCAMISPEQARAALGVIRQRTRRPIGVNFFCHRPPADDPVREADWKARLEPYYLELGLDPAMPTPASARAPFDDAYCLVVEEFRPEIVSFHFGLPEPDLLARVKSAGARIIASATTVDEAVWLEQNGCDAIIAQGAEGGGHRGMFLAEDVSGQIGTFSLLPQVVDAVGVPVIAAGGIADARGVVAALVLGASAVQVGTAYLFTPEANVAPLHAKALRSPEARRTAMTNVFTGRPARGIVNRIMREVVPMAEEAPAFPLAGGALAPLRAASEPQGSADFMSMWSGQSAPISARWGEGLGAGALTLRLAEETRSLLASLAN